MADHIIQSPDLVGKDILQATKICSDIKLKYRVANEKWRLEWFVLNWELEMS